MTVLETADELVLMGSSDGVATITLNSPGNRNALSRQVRADLRRHLDTALEDESIRVIVLGHVGSVFCAGADLKEARDSGPREASAELVAVLTRLLESDKPVIAKLSGSARAGGIGIVAACDFVVASTEVTFGFSEVRIGVVPAIITVPLALRVHTSALQRLFLSGETFAAREAARIGLVDAVVGAGELDETIAAWVASLKLGSPRALAGAKQLVRPAPQDLAARFSMMREVSATYFSSADAREGIRAFAERRAPAWASESTTPSTVETSREQRSAP